MCKCAADKQSGPLGHKPTVRWSDKKCEGEVDTRELTSSGGGRSTRLHCWRRRQGKGAAVCPGRRRNTPPHKKKKIPAVRASREMANLYTGHWCSVQGLIGPKIANVGRFVFPNTHWRAGIKSPWNQWVSYLCFWQVVMVHVLVRGDGREYVQPPWQCQRGEHPVLFLEVGGGCSWGLSEEDWWHLIVGLMLMQTGQNQNIAAQTQACCAEPYASSHQASNSFLTRETFQIPCFPNVYMANMISLSVQICGKQFQALLCFMIAFTVSSEELHFLPHFDG